MPKIDWESFNDSPNQFEPLSPGVYHVKVSSCEERTSKAGNVYFSVRLTQLEGDKTVAFDTIMLSGKGVPMGLAKLTALGFIPGDKEELLAAELLGKKAFVAVKNDEYEGKTRLVVDINASGSKCGYWDEENPPEAAANLDIETPF